MALSEKDLARIRLISRTEGRKTPPVPAMTGAAQGLIAQPQPIPGGQPSTGQSIVPQRVSDFLMGALRGKERLTERVDEELPDFLDFGPSGRDILGYIGTAADVVGRGLELKQAAEQAPYYWGQPRQEPDEMRRFMPPDPRDIPGALLAGGKQLFQGDGLDVDAALAAYDEAAPAGWGYRGLNRLAVEAAAPFGLAKTGVGLSARAPKLAETLGKIVPAPARPRVVRGIETGVEELGEGMRVPWQAEEAFGRGAGRVLGKVAGPVVRPIVSRFKGKDDIDLTPQQIVDTDEILGPPPTTTAEVEATQATTMAQGPRAKLVILEARHEQAKDATRALEERLLQAQQRLEMPAVTEAADVSITPSARKEALTRRLQDQVDRNEAEWFIETFDDQLAAAKEAEEAARMAVKTQENFVRGKAAKEAMAEYKRDVGIGKQPWATTARTSIEPGGAVDDIPPPIEPGGAVDDISPGPSPTSDLRKGNLLQAITTKALGLKYKVKDALRVAQDLDDQITSTRNILRSRAKDALRLTGRIGKTAESGESKTRMLDVPGTPSIYDVAENPLAYPQVTPQQMEGVRKLTRIISDIKEERKLFGIGPDEIRVGEEGDFLHRKVLKVAEGEEALGRGSGTGGGLRSIGIERGRKVGVGDVAEAEARGTVYAHPLESIDEYAERYLTGSANEHMKGLLVPFSETALTRTDPILKQSVETLRQQAQSLRQSGLHLSEEQDVAIKAFIDSDDPAIDAFRDAVGAIRIKRGRFRGQDFAGTQRLLRDIRKESSRLAPAWRKAKLEAKKIPEGRVTISTDYTPMLAGRDFLKADAQAIRKHYWSRGPKYAQNKYMNAVLNTTKSVRFLNATLDFSAFLRQQVSALAIHPITTLNNFFVKSFKDIVDSTAYDALLASPKGQRAASRGVAIFGDAGELAEFQAQNWMDRIPVISKLGIRQFNNHFIRFNTRQRIDLFDLETRIYAKKFKRALTPDEEDAIARGINRATGVSKSRGRGPGWKMVDDSLFAARYTRASIEEVLKLASFGTIEGNMARRYISHLVAVTTGLVTATAIMQKRDLMDVLNPIDTRRLAKNEIALNPNFLSIRVYGHDLKPMGAYDSLARIIFMATDLTYGLITQKQYEELTDFLEYTVGTKGNPLISFGVDLFRDGLPGKTFTGDDTLSPEALIKRVLPFTVQNIATSIQHGMPWKQAFVGGGIEGLGVKTSPMSYSDFSNEFARKQYGNKFVDLEPYQQDVVREGIQSAIEQGEIPQRQTPDGYWAEIEDINLEVATKMAGLEISIMDKSLTKKDAASKYFDIKNAARIRREQAAKDYNYDPDQADPNEKDPNKRALNVYYKLTDMAYLNNVFNPGLYSELRESYESGLADKRPEQLQYIYRNTNRRPVSDVILSVLPPTTVTRIQNSQIARRQVKSGK